MPSSRTAFAVRGRRRRRRRTAAAACRAVGRRAATGQQEQCHGHCAPPDRRLPHDRRPLRRAGPRCGPVILSTGRVADRFSRGGRPTVRGSGQDGGMTAPGHGAERPQQVVVVGPDGQPVGALPMPQSPTRTVGRVDRRHGRAAGQGHADRHDDQAAAGGGPGRAAGRRQPQPAARHPRGVDPRARGGPRPRAARRAGADHAAVHRGRAPSDAELRIAQAQLVGWLEGVFHGIQTALFAQQMAARAQLEEVRRQALPGGGPQADPSRRPVPVAPVP